MEIQIKYKYEGQEWSDVVVPPIFTTKLDAIDFISSLENPDEDNETPKN